MATYQPEYVALGEKLISEFLTGIKTELLNYLQTENRNATGKSAASLEIVNLTASTGQLVGHKGIEFVFRGRGPGGMPPISALVDWCNARGLPRGVAFAVAKTIARAGTKLWQQGRNVLNEIITEERLDALKNNILVTFKAELTSQIKSIIATQAA
jgi:hypothetical protein